jgi:site-specific DNA-methyltransferase (adenine-specific)
MFQIYHNDCLEQKLDAESVDLLICDPPFGLGESQFDKHYNRNYAKVIKGYREAPSDYDKWTLDWLTEAKRVLKDSGSMYIFMGHTNLRALLNAAHTIGLHEINHLIWKYNFGVNTSKKYVTSHYHILYYTKTDKVKPTFNTYCRFSSREKDAQSRSAVYQDLEDVFLINREYAPNQIKNQNKLPENLIRKLVLYSSNEGDIVGDFFMGNFTTAYVATKLGRHAVGYEINKNAYDYHMTELGKIDFGCDLPFLKKIVDDAPRNKGERLDAAVKRNIIQDFNDLLKGGHSKKAANEILQEKYGRGKFGIQNIVRKYKDSGA